MLWFKHFGDARRNPKLLRVERKLGESGYARFFKLLEIIAERGGKGADFRPELNLNGAATDMEWLAAEWSVEEGAARDTLNLFATVGLIDEGAWSQSVINVPQMLEYRDEYVSRRQKKTPALKPQEVETDLKEKKRGRVVEVKEERNGDYPDTIPSVSGHELEGKKMYDSTDRLFEPTGPMWARIGIKHLSVQFKEFAELANAIEPRPEETKAEWCGRVIDACAAKDVPYPPEFYAVTKRFRKKDESVFDYRERVRARNRALLAR